MKTRYKILMVIGIFALFYVQVPWMFKQCDETGADCTVFINLMNWTRMGVFVNDTIWDSGSENTENHTVFDYLRINQNFILTMIVLPSSIIACVVVWDKRK